MISQEELYILSFYRASELAGALLFGRMAMHTDVEELRIPLTEQCSEEAKHSWLITETLQKLGYIPLKVTDTFQVEVAKEFGMPKNVLEILCLTQIFEVRVLEHYIKHSKLRGLNPIIKKTLEEMIEDESGHVSWIEKELKKYAKEHGKAKVEKVLARVRKVDQKVFNKLSKSSPFKEYFKALL